MRGIADHQPVLGKSTVFGFSRRRHRSRPVQPAAAPPADRAEAAEGGLLSIEAAERQLGMLLRRMRAYKRAPYDFAVSRILRESDFEQCLDLATLLSIRIAELGAGLAMTPAERERIRYQVLQSLSSEPMLSG